MFRKFDCAYFACEFAEGTIYYYYFFGIEVALSWFWARKLCVNLKRNLSSSLFENEKRVKQIVSTINGTFPYFSANVKCCQMKYIKRFPICLRRPMSTTPVVPCYLSRYLKSVLYLSPNSVFYEAPKKYKREVDNLFRCQLLNSVQPARNIVQVKLNFLLCQAVKRTSLKWSIERRNTTCIH